MAGDRRTCLLATGQGKTLSAERSRLSILVGSWGRVCFTSPPSYHGESGTGKNWWDAWYRVWTQAGEARDLEFSIIRPIVPGFRSEFFGHEAWGLHAHTLHRDWEAFAMANGGTLFLDGGGEPPIQTPRQNCSVWHSEETSCALKGNNWYQTENPTDFATNKGS